MKTHSADTTSGITIDTHDSELVRLAIQGNTHAFELIMRRHNRLLFRTVRSIVKNDAEAEDVLQEAYVKIWRSLGTFRDDAKLSTWLARIAINEALGRLRRHRATVIPLDAQGISIRDHNVLEQHRPDHPESHVMSTQMRQLLETRIDALPDAFRTVFVLRAVQELSVEETALALDIPEATVRSRFFRARSLLREALARDIDVATADAFSFDGARCDRIVAKVIEQLAASS